MSPQFPFTCVNILMEMGIFDIEFFVFQYVIADWITLKVEFS